jgi:TRAP-type transport system small permease protein
MKIVRIADKTLDILTTILEYMMGIMMIALVCITSIEVVLRYVFNNPTSWSSELARFLLMWVTFTGSSIVTRRCTHLTMGLNIHRFVGGKVSRRIKVLVTIVIAVIMFVIAWYGAKITIISGHRIAPMTKLPMYIPWSAMPVNAIIMTLFLITEAIKQFFTKEGEEEE